MTKKEIKNSIKVGRDYLYTTGEYLGRDYLYTTGEYLPYEDRERVIRLWWFFMVGETLRRGTRGNTLSLYTPETLRSLPVGYWSSPISYADFWELFHI